MPVTLEAGSPAGLLVVRFTDVLTASNTVEPIARISEESAAYSQILTDWSAARFDMSTVDFMGLVDDWFRKPVARLRAAHIFHPDAHKDQAMLFQTKGFLAGGVFRVFSGYGEARSWLESWTGPRA